MYRPLALILTTGAIALSGMTSWIIISVVRENSTQDASFAIPHERIGAPSLPILSSIPPGNSLMSVQADTMPTTSVTNSPFITRLTGGGHNAPPANATPAYLPSQRTISYSATPIMVSDDHGGTVPITTQSLATQQSVITASRPNSSVGYSTTTSFSAPPATATAITSPSVPTVTTTPLDPSALGNSITADGNLVSVDGVQQSSSSSALSLTVSPGSGSSTKTSGHAHSGPSAEELFRAKWGWAAYDLAQRIAKGQAPQ